MNRRGDDHADAENAGGHHDGQREVLLLHKLLPQIVGGELVHDDEAHDEDHHAEQGVDDGVDEDGDVHGDVSG